MLQVYSIIQNQRMSTFMRSQLNSDPSSCNCGGDSDEEADLNWLGDLLDPWKGSKVSYHQDPPSSNRIYRNIFRHYDASIASNKCNLQFHQHQSNEIEEPLNMRNNVIVLDDDQQMQGFQIEVSSVSSERSLILERQQPQQAINLQIIESKKPVGQQHQPSISWSMLFNQQNSHNNNEIQANIPKEGIKQQRRNLSGQNQQVLEVSQMKAPLINENISTQLIYLNKEETVFNNPSLYTSRRKRIPRKLNKVSKKLSIPEALRFEFAQKPQSLKNEQREAIRRQNLMKLQAKKDINLLDCDQNFKDIENIELSESNSFSLLDKDEDNSIYDQDPPNAQQNQTLNNDNKDKALRPRQKRIVSSVQKPLSQKQLQLAQELEAIIHIIKDRSVGDDKQYKWEVGASRYWKSIPHALATSFDNFIRESKKYRSNFLKYLPKHIRSKKQGISKLEGKMDEQEITELKREKIRQCKVKSKRKELSQLKDIFDKTLITKVIEYERLIEERGRAEVLEHFEEAYLTEYEPDTPHLQDIIEEIVVNTNNCRKNRMKTRRQSMNAQKKVQATNELLIHNLSIAADEYNYVQSMRKLYKLNKRHASLSCLDPNSLGLRSNSLKIIDKGTYENEMRIINLMNQPILVNDLEVTSRNQLNPKFEGERNSANIKLQ